MGIAFTRAFAVLKLDDHHSHDLKHENIIPPSELGYSIEKTAAVTLHESGNDLKRCIQLKPESLHLRAQATRTEFIMRTILAFALLASLSIDAASAASFVFPKGIVTDGDGAGTLMQKGGKPDRIVILENKYGGAEGERWEYYLHDKQVNFILIDGRVTRIEEIRN